MNRFFKIILTIIVAMVALSSHAQDNSLGIRGGYGMGFSNFEPIKYSAPAFGGYSVSLVYVHTGFQKYFGALQGELSYTQRAFSHEYKEDGDSVYTRRIRAIEIPFLWRPYYTFSRDKGIVYGIIGPYIHYDISSDWEDRVKSDPNASFNKSGKWEYDSMRDNRLGVGVIAGLGFGWQMVKNLTLSADFRYVYGFSSVFKPAAKYEGNPVQSTTSQMVVSFGITYSFNNKKAKKVDKL